MFDAIAQRYDRLNHLLSAGLDRGWRQRAVRELALTGRERVLDVCTGTADLAIAAATVGSDRGQTGVRPGSDGGQTSLVVGIDFAHEMLRLGADKIERAGLSDRVRLARADATALPLRDATFEAAMVAFGLRNVVDPDRACTEILRVLRPGGRMAILEFGLPRALVLRTIYGWYFRTILPRIGRLISGHGDAYSYLPASVAQFPSPDRFATMIRQSGFTSVRVVPLTFGVVYLYVAEKSPQG